MDDPWIGQAKFGRAATNVNIKRRPTRENFKVWIVSARGLRAADFSLMGKGKSDPFCRAQIHGRPTSKVETPYLAKTLEPEWNYECSFQGVKSDDSLEFEVYDHDMIGAPDLLGRIVLPFDRFAYGLDETVQLEGAQGAQSFLTLRIEKVPKDAVLDPETRCFVKIIGAGGLRAADWGGKSDPFAVCEIIGRPRSRFETKVLWKTVEPVWNEEDELIDYQEEDDVKLEVWDYDIVGAPDSLGYVMIRNEEFHPDGFKGKMLLENCGSGEAWIEVEIEVDTPLPPEDPVDPLENITILQTNRVPFQLRSLETNRVHPLRNFTSIGRSRKLLDPDKDLIIDSKISPDVGRVHGHIKACLLPDYATWLLRIYDAPQERMALQSVDGKYVVSQVDGRLLTNKLDVVPLGVFHVERRGPDRTTVMLRNAQGKYIVAGSDGTRLYANGEGAGETFFLNNHMDGVCSLNLANHKSSWVIADERGNLVLFNSKSGQPPRSRFNKVDVGGGLGVAEGGGHAGTGTSIDGDPIDKDIGAPIRPGSIIRFGKNELWVLECGAIYSKSEKAAAAQTRALILEEDDPAAMRELHIPTIACHDAIQSCKDWISIVRVALEWLNEPDEPPCVDCIEVTDELRRTASVHQVSVFEDQQSYDVRSILKDVRLGTTLRLRLCSDPYLLAPVLTYLTDLESWLASKYDSHVH